MQREGLGQGVGVVVSQTSSSCRGHPCFVVIPVPITTQAVRPAPHPGTVVSAWSSLSVHSRCRSSLLSPPSLSLCVAMLLTAPCEQGLATAGVGTVGVGTRCSCCFLQVPHWMSLLAASPLSSQPVVVILVLRSPSSIRRGGEDAYFGRPSWVGTK